jgi:hypothetical protein
MESFHPPILAHIPDSQSIRSALDPRESSSSVSNERYYTLKTPTLTGPY